MLVMVILVTILLAAGMIYMHYFNKKKEITDVIDTYITENNYEDKIKEKEISFDWKLGTYYANIIFKDETENYYEFYVKDDSKKVYVIGYRYNGNEEITNEEEAKYIDN
ncbi:DUF3139 domain-containing protein [Paraliobacillus sp. JSM ZJ581]|uniref:DUF3139 domain-containing protein n=1 Tax=Paraliobacillus sp. JSM ZJ581 TaxID=3342118 RepID=UPI0035A98758